jgi:hypothetical protein
MGGRQHVVRVPGRLWYTMAVVLYLTADLFGRKIRYPLDGGRRRLAAGAMPDNDLYLPYRGVSRRHFVLEWEDGRWGVRDLGS